MASVHADTCAFEEVIGSLTSTLCQLSVKILSAFVIVVPIDVCKNQHVQFLNENPPRLLRPLSCRDEKNVPQLKQEERDSCGEWRSRSGRDRSCSCGKWSRNRRSGVVLEAAVHTRYIFYCRIHICIQKKSTSNNICTPILCNMYILVVEGLCTYTLAS